MRQSRVEPVFGTLTQYLGMRKINVRGIAGANKCMHMAAITYNLKKLLKYSTRKSKSGAKSALLKQFEKYLNVMINNCILSLLNFDLNSLKAKN